MADTINAPEESHHVAAGIGYLLLATVPAVLILTWHGHFSATAALVSIVDLGFLSGCAFYRARVGSESLPDRVERARRMITYATGICATLGVVAWIVIAISKLLQ